MPEALAPYTACGPGRAARGTPACWGGQFPPPSPPCQGPRPRGRRCGTRGPLLRDAAQRPIVQPLPWITGSRQGLGRCQGLLRAAAGWGGQAPAIPCLGPLCPRRAALAAPSQPSQPQTPSLQGLGAPVKPAPAPGQSPVAPRLPLGSPRMRARLQPPGPGTTQTCSPLGARPSLRSLVPGRARGLSGGRTGLILPPAPGLGNAGAMLLRGAVGAQAMPVLARGVGAAPPRPPCRPVPGLRTEATRCLGQTIALSWGISCCPPGLVLEPRGRTCDVRPLLQGTAQAPGPRLNPRALWPLSTAALTMLGVGVGSTHPQAALLPLHALSSWGSRHGAGPRTLWASLVPVVLEPGSGQGVSGGPRPLPAGAAKAPRGHLLIARMSSPHRGAAGKTRGLCNPLGWALNGLLFPLLHALRSKPRRAAPGVGFPGSRLRGVSWWGGGVGPPRGLSRGGRQRWSCPPSPGWQHRDTAGRWRKAGAWPRALCATPETLGPGLERGRTGGGMPSGHPTLPRGSRAREGTSVRPDEGGGAGSEHVGRWPRSCQAWELQDGHLRGCEMPTAPRAQGRAWAAVRRPSGALRVLVPSGCLLFSFSLNAEDRRATAGVERRPGGWANAAGAQRGQRRQDEAGERLRAGEAGLQQAGLG